MTDEQERILWIVLAGLGLVWLLNSSGSSDPTATVSPSGPFPQTPDYPVSQTPDYPTNDYSVSQGDDMALRPLPVSQAHQTVLTLDNDTEILARTIYGEARGETSAGKQAVASVIMNRFHAGTYPGAGTIAGICRAPNQFSCWNTNDPNYPIVTSANINNSTFHECISIAQQAIAGTLPDNTEGATFYETNARLASAGIPHDWGVVQQTVTIDNQTFFAPGGALVA